MPPGGMAREITGTLTFGVGTSTNNQPGQVSLIPLSATGRFTTIYRDKTYPDSLIDSGTETYILDDPQLPRCPGLAWAFCVRPDRWIGAAMVGATGVRVPWRIRIGDYRASRARKDGASDGMAVAADPGSMSFVWGAPFFLGKRLVLVLDGMSVPGVPGLKGPFYGIQSRTTRSPPP